MPSYHREATKCCHKTLCKLDLWSCVLKYTSTTLKVAVGAICTRAKCQIYLLATQSQLRHVLRAKMQAKFQTGKVKEKRTNYKRLDWSNGFSQSIKHAINRKPNSKFTKRGPGYAHHSLNFKMKQLWSKSMGGGALLKVPSTCRCISIN